MEQILQWLEAVVCIRAFWIWSMTTMGEDALWGFVFAAGDDDVERSFGDGIGTVLPAEGAVESVG